MRGFETRAVETHSCTEKPSSCLRRFVATIRAALKGPIRWTAIAAQTKESTFTQSTVETSLELRPSGFSKIDFFFAKYS